MLRNNVQAYIAKEMEGLEGKNDCDKVHIELYKEEIDYMVRHDLLPENFFKKIILKEKDSVSRFEDAYMERCDKESEEMIAKGNPSLLRETIKILKKNLNEFIYLESPWFERLGSEGVSLEVDDVFGTYDVMLGLKLPRKAEPTIRSYLQNALPGEGIQYDLLYSHNEGLWNLNFTLNRVKGFYEDLTIGEAYSLIYGILFHLVEMVEENS